MIDTIFPFLDRHFDSERSWVISKTINLHTCISHQVYKEGSLKATLSIMVVDTADPNLNVLSPPVLTYAWLHLRSGQVSGCVINGKANHDDLVKLVEANHQHETMCHAPVAPNRFIVEELNQKYGIGAIHKLLKNDEATLSELECLTITKHFKKIFSIDNPDIIAFRNGLNHEVMQLLDFIKRSFPYKADQLVAYNFLTSCTSIILRNRIQALITLPWLVPHLTGVLSEKFSLSNLCTPICSVLPEFATSQNILCAIDEGQPLFDTVARALNVPREVLAWSKYQVLPDVSQLNHRMVATLLRLLSGIPASQRPTCDDDWKRMGELLDVYFQVIAAVYAAPISLLVIDCDMGKSNTGQAVEKILMNWLRADAHMITKGFSKNRIEHMLMLKKSTDFLSALSKTLTRKIKSKVSKRSEIKNLHTITMLEWLKLTSLKTITTVSKAWEDGLPNYIPQGLQTMPAKLAEVDLNDWPVLLPEPMKLGLLVITQLTNAATLRLEGRVLKHCIADYADRCQNGDSVIFSIGAEPNVHFSTLELCLSDDGLLVEVGHKGFKNYVASKGCIAAALTLLTHLNSSACDDVRQTLQLRKTQAKLIQVHSLQNDVVQAKQIGFAWHIVQTHPVMSEFRQLAEVIG
ncbi:PcfJ domain-containing protein [Undibacterium sp. SXout11W]|uniref:PcfJ domain-containing protein n=1 Tax=Undibacterium sp. SXout11W TaxID=3413050 RepID=UPI003BF37FCF